MIKLRLLTLLLVVSVAATAQQELLSPKEFLGYELGERFTRHHRVVEYYQHVASVASNVSLFKYGETYENRPLIYAVLEKYELG